MHGIANIVTHFTPPSAQGAGTGTSPGQSGNGFQAAMSTKSAFNPPSAQGVSAGISASLGSQTASVLLQTQDLNQTQAHGGGGGGHHGSMKMMPGLEAEEAGESEEAQQLCQRKKLAKTIKPSDVSETVEVDENGVAVTSDVEPGEAPQKKGDLDTETRQSSLG